MKKILVVEDNHEIREEICDIFKMENYNVIEAETGLDGFMKATNELPDLIISDIMMPVLDGFRMVKELKKNNFTNCIPVVFLSALSSDEDIRIGMNLGADDYLTKPINPNDLINATSSKLDKYSKVDEKFEDVKTSLTNILYHELNTPLNGIIGFSDYLKTNVYEIRKENIKQIVENIYKSGIRLHQLVQKYLCYSELKIKSANISEVKNMRKCQFIETSTIINEIIHSDMCKERESDFDISINDVELKIDRELFKKMIKELIENAIKFSEPGNQISVKTSVNNEKYSIKIKNKGAGMTLKQINSINDFCQFDKKKYAQNGSGIGLSIVKLIMKIYGGNLEISSVPKMFFLVTLTFNNSFRM